MFKQFLEDFLKAYRMELESNGSNPVPAPLTVKKRYHSERTAVCIDIYQGDKRIATIFFKEAYDLIRKHLFK